MLKTIIGLVLISMVYACSPTLNYLGKSYTSTTKVDVYYDEFDIDRTYEVMGMVRNVADDWDIDDPTSVKNAMVEKAKSVGADAILFLGQFTEEIEDTFTSGTVRAKIYEARFLKYKA